MKIDSFFSNKYAPNVPYTFVNLGNMTITYTGRYLTIFGFN